MITRIDHNIELVEPHGLVRCALDVDNDNDVLDMNRVSEARPILLGARAGLAPLTDLARIGSWHLRRVSALDRAKARS